MCLTWRRSPCSFSSTEGREIRMWEHRLTVRGQREVRSCAQAGLGSLCPPHLLSSPLLLSLWERPWGQGHFWVCKCPVGARVSPRTSPPSPDVARPRQGAAAARPRAVPTTPLNPAQGDHGAPTGLKARCKERRADREAREPGGVGTLPGSPTGPQDRARTHLDGEVPNQVLHALAHPLHTDGEGAVGAFLLGPVVDAFLQGYGRVWGCRGARGPHCVSKLPFARCLWEGASPGEVWGCRKGGGGLVGQIPLPLLPSLCHSLWLSDPGPAWQSPSTHVLPP